ncbi:MAG: rane protein [Belnapia sp.]|jgi:nitrogen fixation protein FixH|nr:rane protein [Belnapia sp.]
MTGQRSRWIPWVFVGGMLLVLAVNGGLILAAIRTSSGVAISRPYERGRGYDRVLAAAARQDALGWSAEVAVEGAALLVGLHDRDGQPVAATLTGLLQRPAERDAVPLDWLPLGPGRWSAPLAGIRRGQWEARLTLAAPDGARFEAQRRILLP